MSIARFTKRAGPLHSPAPFEGRSRFRLERLRRWRRLSRAARFELVCWFITVGVIAAIGNTWLR